MSYRWRASCWETSPRGSDRGSLEKDPPLAGTSPAAYRCTGSSAAGTAEPWPCLRSVGSRSLGWLRSMLTERPLYGGQPESSRSHLEPLGRQPSDQIASCRCGCVCCAQTGDLLHGFRELGCLLPVNRFVESGRMHGPAAGVAQCGLLATVFGWCRVELLPSPSLGGLSFSVG